MQKTIEKIHRKFDTAGEKLLAEAKRILSIPIVDKQSKIERLNKIGFTSAKEIREKGFAQKEKVKAQEIIDAVEYYQLHYPNYKFISEEQIQKICKKYGLLYGDSKNYLGDIPDKNLSEIEAFKLREEDYYEETNWMEQWMGAMLYPTRRTQRRIEYRYNESGLIAGIDATEGFNGLIPTIQERDNIFDYDEEITPKVKKVKLSFKICAPQKDFNMQGYEVKDGFKLVYDPIVIQPVKFKSISGGLVISKWGLEGEDESLVNEKMN